MMVIFLFGTLVPGFALDRPAVESGRAKYGVVANPNIVKYTLHMTWQSLAGRADTDLVELPNGQHVKVGTLRNFQTAARIMRSPRVDRTPRELKSLPNKSSFTTVRSASDLTASLKLPDSTTVRLPSGKFATVGQIRFVQKTIDKKSGFKLTALSMRPDLSGPAIKIPKDMNQSMTKDQQEKFWENILQNPDRTVLESPNGTRITVADLKQGLTKNIKTMPRENTPLTTTEQIQQRRVK